MTVSVGACYNSRPFLRPGSHGLTSRPGATRAVAKKLYIRTFGCQMNEYDSDKMADVLHASDGLTLTDRPEDADVILFNTCSVREKAQERVFHDLGRVRALKADKPDLMIGVGGCVASQEGAGDRQARALRRCRVRTADAASAAATARAAPGHRSRASRHQFSRDREIRSSAAAARRGRDRVRVDHGRLQQVLLVLRRPVYARRGSLAAVRRCADRDRGSRRPGRPGNHAARPERQRLSRVHG